MLSNLYQHIRFLDKTHSFVSISSWAQFPWIIQVCLRLMRYLRCYVKNGLWPCKVQMPGCQKVCMHLRRKGYMIHELVLYGCTCFKMCDSFPAFKDWLNMNIQHMMKEHFIVWTYWTNTRPLIEQFAEPNSEPPRTRHFIHKKNWMNWAMTFLNKKIKGS